ncbi:MAG: MCP four helix bundle domain-containing protein [Flavobacteriaceae bacterium]
MTFYNKIKWVLGILMIFILILSTNLIDRKNFIRMKDSVVTIYEDRIIANDLIFEMSNSVHEKEIAVVLLDSVFFNQVNLKVNADFQSLISRFELTKLTAEEGKIFDELKNNIQSLIKAEDIFINSGFVNEAEVVKYISKIKYNLSGLSKIQLNEGRKQMSISKRAIDTVELFTQIEVYFLVFLAIIIQIIVMYQPKETS